MEMRENKSRYHGENHHQDKNKTWGNRKIRNIYIKHKSEARISHTFYYAKMKNRTTRELEQKAVGKTKTNFDAEK